MINSRLIDDLHPLVAEKARDFLLACAEAKIDVLITSTYRDQESQAELYAQGRTKPGKKVTNAKPGYSYHNFRLAFDFVPMLHGKPQWDDHALFRRCGEIAESVGLDWAGRWVKFREMAHCQFTSGLSLADFRAGKTLDGSHGH